MSLEGGLVRQTVQQSPSGGNYFPEGPDDFFHTSPSDLEEPTSENLATLHCQQCGPLGFFCHECFKRCHRHVNFFHVSEKWEEGHFVPLLNEEHHVDVRPRHNCSSKQDILILCLDDYGIEHRLLRPVHTA